MTGKLRQQKVFTIMIIFVVIALSVKVFLLSHESSSTKRIQLAPSIFISPPGVTGIHIPPIFERYLKGHSRAQNRCGGAIEKIQYGTTYIQQKFRGCELRANIVAKFPHPTPVPTRVVYPTPTRYVTYPTPTQPVATVPPSTCTGNTDSCEQYVLQLINADRAKFGVRALVLSSKQNGCSYVHSVHMAAVGYISHDQFPADVCIPWQNVGENAGEAAGYGETGGLLTIHEQMMAEPGWTPGCQSSHKCNILYAGYTTVGIGIDYVNGGVWLTEDFTG